MTNPNAQRGATFITTAMMLAMAGVFVMVAIKVGPLYYDFFAVKDVTNEVSEEMGAKRMSRTDVWTLFSNRLRMNNITYLKQDDLKVEQNKYGDPVLTVAYEKREPLFGNLSLLVSFRHQVGE